MQRMGVNGGGGALPVDDGGLFFCGGCFASGSANYGWTVGNNFNDPCYGGVCGGAPCDPTCGGPTGGPPHPRPIGPLPHPCDTTGNSDVDSLVQKDTSGLLADAMTALSNLGIKPKVVSGTLPAGEAASYDQTTNTLTWDPNQVANSGQPVDQILFHELSHVYYENSLIPMPAGGMVTLKIGSYSVTYNLNTNGGRDGYEHVLTHNAIQGAYITDDTGAVWQMFGYSGPNDPSDSGVTVTDADGSAVDRKEAGEKFRNKNVSISLGPKTSFNAAIKADGTGCVYNASGSTGQAKPTGALTPTSSAWSGLDGEIYE